MTFIIQLKTNDNFRKEKRKRKEKKRKIINEN